MPTPEGKFKRIIKNQIRTLFPGCYLSEMKNSDQGIPDTLILFEDKWALLEFKKSKDADHQPNQDYYVRLFNEMSFAAFIYPENANDILNDLCKFFRR
jgi:hypothetical protein